MAGMQFCRELGLPALIGLKSVAVISGTPSLHTDGPLAIVMASGFLEVIDEYMIDDEYKRISLENKNLGKKILAAVCMVKRKGFDAQETVFRSADAPNKAGPWTDYREIMMKRRCRAIALKDRFPDILNGISIAEYDMDVLVNNDGSISGAEKGKASIDLNAAISAAGEVPQVL